LLMNLINQEEVDLSSIMKKYMTLKISFKRKSREEFVNTFNKEDAKEKEIQNFNFTR